MNYSTKKKEYEKINKEINIIKKDLIQDTFGDNNYEDNKENILIKRACDKIFVSLKKYAHQNFFNHVDNEFIKNFNMVKKLEIFNVVDGIAGTLYSFVDDCWHVGVDLVLDDGRLRPRDYFWDVDDYFDVMDGRKWVFHDGG